MSDAVSDAIRQDRRENAAKETLINTLMDLSWMATTKEKNECYDQLCKDRKLQDYLWGFKPPNNLKDMIDTISKIEYKKRKNFVIIVVANYIYSYKYESLQIGRV